MALLSLAPISFEALGTPRGPLLSSEGWQCSSPLAELVEEWGVGEEMT